MWQQCHLEAKVRLQLLLALLRSQENAELLPAGSGLLIQILEVMQKEKKGGKELLPFLGAPVQKCLLFLSVSCVWLESLGAGAVPALSNVHTCAICSDWHGLGLLESIPWPGQKQQRQQQEKVLPNQEG